MKKKLVIISNDRFYNDKKDFYCDHVAEKTLPDGLSDRFLVTVIGRKTKIKRFHKLNTSNIESYKYFISYIFAISKKLFLSESKFLILSISPYTFFASLLFVFSKSKPFVYLRSDGHQEYKSILGFYGPFVYGLMFNIVSKISIFISCKKYILKKKSGFIVSPSELTPKWNSNTTSPKFETIKLLYVGRLKIEKGIFSLLNLVKKLPEKITLTIVGESHEAEEKIFQENVNIFPIENDENELIKHYDNHDIFILPSCTEGHPMVLLESLARKRPVIIFDDIEHVIENKKGIFISKRNQSSLIETIDYIKRNYNQIRHDMELNQLPTKDSFLNEIKNVIEKIK